MQTCKRQIFLYLGAGEESWLCAGNRAGPSSPPQQLYLAMNIINVFAMDLTDTILFLCSLEDSSKT